MAALRAAEQPDWPWGPSFKSARCPMAGSPHNPATSGLSAVRRPARQPHAHRTPARPPARRPAAPPDPAETTTSGFVTFYNPGGRDRHRCGDGPPEGAPSSTAARIVERCGASLRRSTSRVRSSGGAPPDAAAPTPSQSAAWRGTCACAARVRRARAPAKSGRSAWGLCSHLFKECARIVHRVRKNPAEANTCWQRDLHTCRVPLHQLGGNRTRAVRTERCERSCCCVGVGRRGGGVGPSGASLRGRCARATARLEVRGMAIQPEPRKRPLLLGPLRHHLPGVALGVAAPEAVPVARRRSARTRTHTCPPATLCGIDMVRRTEPSTLSCARSPGHPSAQTPSSSGCAGRPAEALALDVPRAIFEDEDRRLVDLGGDASRRRQPRMMPAGMAAAPQNQQAATKRTRCSRQGMHSTAAAPVSAPA